MNNKKIKEFYEHGLKFECTGCGNCCTGAPGYVYLSEIDIHRIADYLEIDVIKFIKEYTRVVKVFGEKRLSLIEKRNYDCIFFKDKRCTIYPARPYQCKSYPFWKKNVKSYKDWNCVARECPGVNRGRVYTKKEIESIVNNTPEYNLKTFKVIADVEI